MNCKNCTSEVNDNYCPSCGQPAILKRIDGHYILHEIEHVLHFEKGIFLTIRELLVRPGKNVREFLSENRTRLVKPILFVVVSSLIYTIITHFFHVEDGYVAYGGADKTTTAAIFEWIESHYGYANIIMGIFIASWLKLFFRKSHYNFFEILILLCFVMGIGMLLLSAFALIGSLVGVSLMQLAGLVSIVYCSWAIGQFFGARKITSYLKAFAAYMLGLVAFSVSAVVLGFVFDLLVK